MSKTDFGAIREQAIQKMRDAWKTSTGDAPPPAVASPSVPSQAPASAIRLDAVEATRRVSQWSRDLWLSSTGRINK